MVQGPLRPRRRRHRPAQVTLRRLQPTHDLVPTTRSWSTDATADAPRLSRQPVVHTWPARHPLLRRRAAGPRTHVALRQPVRELERSPAALHARRSARPASTTSPTIVVSQLRCIRRTSARRARGGCGREAEKLGACRQTRITHPRPATLAGESPAAEGLDLDGENGRALYRQDRDADVCGLANGAEVLCTPRRSTSRSRAPPRRRAPHSRCAHPASHRARPFEGQVRLRPPRRRLSLAQADDVNP